MPDTHYSEPVSRLLTLGDPRSEHGEQDWRLEHQWRDYPAQFGLKQDHIPELIRMATDEELNTSPSDALEVWAPVHAWRSLGQLRAKEAVRPLLTLLHRIDDDNDDWVGEDLPAALAMIGPAAIQAVSEYLGSPKNKLWARVAAAVTLANIGSTHPQARGESVAALVAALENYAQNDDLLNGEIVAALAKLGAVEASPLVERAYKADRVDESIMGNWEDYQVKVGLLEERLTVPDDDLELSPPLEFTNPPQKRLVRKVEKKAKKKRKPAKEMRMKNRKKK